MTDVTKGDKKEQKPGLDAHRLLYITKHEVFFTLSCMLPHVYTTQLIITQTLNIYMHCYLKT